MENYLIASSMVLLVGLVVIATIGVLGSLHQKR